jgi:hypothetical protein
MSAAEEGALTLFGASGGTVGGASGGGPTPEVRHASF